jgi:hypothetical protein
VHPCVVDDFRKIHVSNNDVLSHNVTKFVSSFQYIMVLTQLLKSLRISSLIYFKRLVYLHTVSKSSPLK